jgi:UDP-N-acetylmuramoyl-tripeptide--D-alanyl-D-alanine ligase
MGKIISLVGNLIFVFTPGFSISVLYMLQSTEYKTKEYMRWLTHFPDFRHIQHRKTLVWTPKIKILALVSWAAYILTFVVAAVVMYRYGIYGLASIILIPLIQAIVGPFINWLGYNVYQRHQEAKMITQAQSLIEGHPGIKIGIAGSYGKTTVKEILRTVLEERFHVAATHANYNTFIGISRFVRKLDGTEDVLLFEYGEERRDDIKRFTAFTKPSIGVMTGISTAHLSSFGTVENIIETIFDLERAPSMRYVYKNYDDTNIRQHGAMTDLDYTTKGCDGWNVTHIKSTLQGMKFSVTKQDTHIDIKTHLIGEHLIGPIVACIAIAYRLGMSTDEIKRGMSRVQPFEHRMQPRVLGGALIIDDTYNGNESGINAGLELLKTSGAKRRIYVTPGLVEQGTQTREVHVRIGNKIAECADIVILMKNSVTQYIKQGISERGYAGEIIEIDIPLEFYQNIDHFIASGDVVLMQNDWTDNYT